MRSSTSPHTLKWLLLPLVAVVALVAVLITISTYWTTLSPSPYRAAYYGWWLGAPFFPWFFFIPLFLLAFFALRWVFCWPWGWGRYWYMDRRSDPAMDTVRQRFAKGLLRARLRRNSSSKCGEIWKEHISQGRAIVAGRSLVQ